MSRECSVFLLCTLLSEGCTTCWPVLEEPRAELGLLYGLDPLESTHVSSPLGLQDDDFVARDDFDDTDQLRIGNDGIFMLTFFSKYLLKLNFFQAVTHNTWRYFHTQVCVAPERTGVQGVSFPSLEYKEGLTCGFSPPFSVAFLFNWIGFFLSFCLTTSAAGRYGAISGFGLSLIKWILIVRVSCTV